MTDRKRAALARLMLFTGAILWGSSYFVLKNTLDEVPLFLLLSIRFFFAGLILLAVRAPYLRRLNRRCLGTGALTGEAVSGHHSEGRYYLTNNRAEVAYYRRRADALLENAKPLMEIYRADGASRLNAFLLADSRTPGRRRCVLSAPPLYTADPAFLTAVLQRHDVPAPDQERILTHAKGCREQAETILRDNEMVLALPRLTEEAFERYPMSLPLSGSFYERDIPYTYQEYLEHVDQTEQFAAVHPRCHLELTADSTFRNLQIVMHEGRWAMVSKEKSPAIHFVIRHAKLRSAIESFEPPLVEE